MKTIKHKVGKQMSGGENVKKKSGLANRRQSMKSGDACANVVHRNDE